MTRSEASLHLKPEQKSENCPLELLWPQKVVDGAIKRPIHCKKIKKIIILSTSRDKMFLHCFN